jgi:hypothetical protein
LNGDLGQNRGAFTEALERAFSMEHEDAEEIAGVVLEKFATADEVDDETLDAETRSVFYTLEGQRILSFRRVERTTEEGAHRRSFFWRLRAEALEKPVEIPVQDMDVYDSLPATAWRHAA